MMATSGPRDDAGAGRVIATPGICGGQWRVSGTRITVRVLARSRELGMTDQELLEDYPSLKSEDLAAVWSFTDQNPAAVRS